LYSNSALQYSASVSSYSFHLISTGAELLLQASKLVGTSMRHHKHGKKLIGAWIRICHKHGKLVGALINIWSMAKAPESKAATSIKAKKKRRRIWN
jgi:hypothetical protein